MAAVFLKILNMGINAGWVMAAVIVLRALLKKAPKWVRCVLWTFVAIRLVCPLSLESGLSLIPSARAIDTTTYSTRPRIDTGIPVIDTPANDYLGSRYYEGVTVPTNHTANIMTVLSVIWLAGIAALAVYAAVGYLRLQKKVRVSVPLEGNIFLCDEISTPFLLGIIQPRIYLPSAIPKQQMDHVIAHERAHLKRLDHLFKPLGFALLAVYWFHPLCWVSYLLFCRDIELACDEKVIKGLDMEHKKAYSEALLSCSAGRRMVAACPLAFGEVGVKERVKSVLRYKKPALWVMLAAATVCAATAVCTLTTPADTTLYNITHQKGYTTTDQFHQDVTLSIPKDTLPDSVYTTKGCRFKKGEVVVYQDNTTSIYLRSARLTDETNAKVCFTFDFSYRLPKEGSILLPYTLNEGGRQACINLRSKTLTDDGKEYPLAVTIRSQGPEEEFGLSLSADVCRAAAGSIKIHAFCNRLTYTNQVRNPIERVEGKHYQVIAKVYDSAIYSYYVTPENAPQYFISDGKNLLEQSGEIAGSPWREVGTLIEIELENSDTERLFINADAIWQEGYSWATLRKNNQTAWYTEKGERSYYILLQKNGEVYLALGSKIPDAEHIRWIFKIQPTEAGPDVKA